MNRKTKTLIATVAAAAVAIPGAVAATDVPDAGALALAVVETEQQNMAWYTDLDSDALDNESCREDLTAPVYQPQIDGRVIVLGEITAVGNISCVDIRLASNATIRGEMTLWYRTTAGAWTEERDARRPLTGSMVKGAGQAHGVLNYVFPYNHPATNRPVRVCIQTFEPDWSPKLCRLAATAKATIH